MKNSHGFRAFVFALFACSPLASAQCGLSWSDSFGPAGLDNAAWCFETFNDGTGPALYAGGAFLSAGAFVANNIAKWNGSIWTSVGTGTNGYVSDLRAFNDGNGTQIYAVGQFTMAGGTTLNGLARWNGAAWTQVGPGANGPCNDLQIYDDGALGGPSLLVSGYFFNGTSNVESVRRLNGGAWATVNLGVTTLRSSVVADLGFGTRLYFPHPSFGIASVTTLASAPMSAFPSPPGFLVKLAVYDSGTGPQLYAATSGSAFGPSGNVSRWNGTSWVVVGGGVISALGGATVEDLLVADDGNGPALFATGFFSSIGGLPTPGVGRFDGVNWAPMAMGLQRRNAVGIGRALGAFDDGSGLSIYVAGTFQRVGTIGVNNVARWRLGQWSPAGFSQGVGFDLFTLASHDDGSGPALYASGSFGAAGNTVVDGLARWNGTTWSPVGSGLTIGSVGSMKSWNSPAGPLLVCVGEFTSLGGVPAAGIAAWNGTNFTSLGSGFGGFQPFPLSVRALEIFDFGAGPNVVATGNFTTAGGVATPSGIAAWNGTTWQAIVAPPVGMLTHLQSFDDGTGTALYGLGRATLGSNTLWGCSKYSAGAWTTLPVTFTSITPSFTNMHSMAVLNTPTGQELYVSGNFTSVGTALGLVPARGIARFDGTTWSGVGGGVTSGILGACNTCSSRVAAFDDGRGPAIYLAGDFSEVGGVAANRIARFDGTAWSPLETGLDFTPQPFFNALVAHDDGSGPALFVGGRLGRAGENAASNIARWNGIRPSLDVTQPGGPGTGVIVQNSGLTIGFEYWNIFSIELCLPNPGAGPYLGLCAADPSFLLLQFTSPLGTAPFHFLATGTSTSFGPYLLPTGTMLDGIAIGNLSGQICSSPAKRFSIN